MHSIASRALIAALLLAAALSINGATFVVPNDADLIHRSDLIVTGTALKPYARISADGGIETVTPAVVHEVLKGATRSATIDIVEPGGHLGQLFTIIPGAPQFTPDEQLLLLLRRIGDNEYAVTELVLGKFRLQSDSRGERVAVRDADEIRGWDTNLRPYQERTRLAEPFLEFVRNEVAGKHPAAQYFLDAPAPLHSAGNSVTTARAATNAAYTATSYTMTISGTMGGRWNVFPNAVTFYSGTTQEPGAPGGGSTAVQAGIAAWDNDPGSNVNYVYGGTDPGNHTQGLHASDGANTVLFERDLSSWGVSPFTCSGTSYSGTLGLGGITSASGTNSVNGETFVTALEGDVEMNRGIANCTLLFNSGDFNTAVAHELGHTLGFRHSDQTRDSSGACSNDPSLECSSNAVMRSFVPNGINATLQPWDINAVRAVYPGTTTTCTPPSVTATASSTSITAGSSVTLTANASGTTPLSYQWYTGTSGNTASPINGANSSTLTVSPASTTSYWVKVSNSCGSANSNTVTITVTSANCTPPSSATATASAGSYRAGQPAVTLTATSSGGTAPLSYQWYTQIVTSTGAGSSTAISGATSATLSVTPSATTTYYVVVRNACGSATSNVVTVTVSTLTTASKRRGDYDGDGRTDMVLFRPSIGTWIFRFSSGGVKSINWGANGDIPAPADVDGDRVTDMIVFRPSTGVWYIRYSQGGSTTQVWGASGDVPAPADYDGDGKADIAVFRPSVGAFIIRYATGAYQSITWGASGDIPVPADYDGDGRIDVAVYRPSNGTWYIRLSSGGSSTIQFGNSTDVPVPGYYDSDNKADIALYRDSIGTWIIRYSTGGVQSIVWGDPNDTPVPGDYNGDGIVDLAIWQKSDGLWWVRGGEKVDWGDPGDIPLSQ